MTRARCQQENPPRAKFCLECAAPFVRRCASGGTPLPRAAKFCFECAAPVAGAVSSARFAAPDTYTPKPLADRIIDSRAALEGERKQVTVLFADLKGSMEFLADRDPRSAENPRPCPRADDGGRPSVRRHGQSGRRRKPLVKVNGAAVRVGGSS